MSQRLRERRTEAYVVTRRDGLFVTDVGYPIQWGALNDRRIWTSRTLVELFVAQRLSSAVPMLGIKIVRL